MQHHYEVNATMDSLAYLAPSCDLEPALPTSLLPDARGVAGMLSSCNEERFQRSADVAMSTVLMSSALTLPFGGAADAVCETSMSG